PGGGLVDAAVDAGGADAPSHRGEPTMSPVAPRAGFMYQGGQTKFRTAAGAICTGRVAASMSTSGFCFLASNDEVMCAGLIGGTNYGMSFAPTGQSGATQIMVMFSGQGMCVARTDHTVQCMGTSTTPLGPPGVTTTFKQW